ncbi:MAG TPA: ABC transporter ATP-binding protein, partial [Anaerolineae bacterium]|nr:ABC transporter ATP-binding protein [Anaerolineae bacterium]
MSIITVSGLSKAYGANDVFDNLNLKIEHGERIGLIGPNGEGKTTLLKLLAGLESPTTGIIQRKRGLRVGYLPQDPPPPDRRTLYEDVLEVFAHLRSQQAQLAELEHQLATAASDAAAQEQLLTRYGELQAAFEGAGGYDYEVHVRQVLGSLGFDESDYNQPLSHLSGGQRTRALLARLLLQEPDLLLLDEPTNHLDLEAVEWLEEKLLSWHGSLVVVAHDRYFLDKVTTRIWDLARGRLESYRGNYSHYAQQRAEREARQWEVWRQQQEFIARTEEYVRRYKAGQRSKQARGRLKRLERFKKEEAIERPTKERRLHLGLTTDIRSGDLVLATRNLEIGYDTPLFRCPDLEIRGGQRVALIGPNGVGKTTFLKAILGQVRPLRGRIRIGASVEIGYLAQASDDLDPSQSVLDAILDADPDMTIGEARNFLGRFLFSGDAVFQPIETLSGGQRSRVALARLTLKGANFLLLDEPTNHLDIASQEVLEAVLQSFPGTILLVSHDRYLVQALATDVWVIVEGTLHAYEGNWEDYRRQEAQELARAALEPEGTVGESQQAYERGREERRRRQEAEKRAEQAEALLVQIEEMERRLAKLGDELAIASQKRQLERVHQLGMEYQRTEQQVHALTEKWATLV